MAKSAKEYKYSVSNLVKDLDVTEQSVRVKLRRAQVEKNEDGVYGWDSQKDYKEVLAELKSGAEDKPAKPSKKKAKKKVAAKKVKKGDDEGDDNE
jgi:hypothetical protein